MQPKERSSSPTSLYGRSHTPNTPKYFFKADRPYPAEVHMMLQMENEVHIIDWQLCQQIRSPYKSLESYLRANMKSRYDQHGIVGDDQLEVKIAIATKACQETSKLDR